MNRNRTTEMVIMYLLPVGTCRWMTSNAPSLSAPPSNQSVASCCIAVQTTVELRDSAQIVLLVHRLALD